MSKSRRLLIQSSIVLVMGLVALAAPPRASAEMVLCAACDDTCEDAITRLTCDGLNCGQTAWCSYEPSPYCGGGAQYYASCMWGS